VEIRSFPEDEDGNIQCGCGLVLKMLDTATLTSHIGRPQQQWYLTETHGQYWYMRSAARAIANATEEAKTADEVADALETPSRKKLKVDPKISAFFVKAVKNTKSSSCSTLTIPSNEDFNFLSSPDKDELNNVSFTVDDNLSNDVFSIEKDKICAKSVPSGSLQKISAPTNSKSMVIDSNVSSEHGTDVDVMDLCNGICFDDWPSPFCENYPFQTASAELPWIVDSTGTFLSTNCEIYKTADQVCRKPCSDLQSNNALKKKLKTSKEIFTSTERSRGTPHSKMSYAQIGFLARSYREQRDEIRLNNLNMGKKVASMTALMDNHKRLLQAIAHNDVPRTSQLLRACLKHVDSVQSMISKFSDALDGLCRAKQFTSLDVDIGILILRIGWQRLCRTLHAALATPSPRYLTGHTELGHFQVAHGRITDPNCCKGGKASKNKKYSKWWWAVRDTPVAETFQAQGSNVQMINPELWKKKI